MNFELMLKIAAVVLGFLSLYFVVTHGNDDYTFVSIILTACVGFLSYRFHLKARLDSQQKDELPEN